MSNVIASFILLLLIVNVFSFLIALGDWVWHRIIFQTEMKNWWAKWNYIKYQWLHDVNKVSDGSDAFFIVMDIGMLIVGALALSALYAFGLVVPAVLLCVAIYGARQYVAYTKEKE